MSAPDWMTSWAFWGEAAKLLVQLAGALLIAKLAVQWALDCYKSEKRVERETRQTLELLAALVEIEYLMKEWPHEEYTHAHSDEDRSTYRRDRFRSARIKIGALAASSSILLPRNLQRGVNGLVATLDNMPVSDDGHYVVDYEYVLRLISEVRDELFAFRRPRVQ